MPNLVIRNECPGDAEPIAKITRDAFAEHPHSSHTEHLIIDALRRSRALKLSLVAEVDGAVVGQIAFSRVGISDGTEEWYGLGPVSVAPAHQARGIGQTLVRHGLTNLREMGAKGCVVLGEPSFYARFGFTCDQDLRLPGVPPEFFLSLPFGTERPQGEVSYHPSFDTTEEDPSGI